MSRPGSGRRCCPLDRDRGSSSCASNGDLIIEASVGRPPTVLTAGGTCPIEGVATLGGVGDDRDSRRRRPHQKFSHGSLGVPSVPLEPNLPKPHIEQLHLRIDEVISPHSTPRFLEAVVVLLVKIREFEERILVIALLF